MESAISRRKSVNKSKSIQNSSQLSGASSQGFTEKITFEKVQVEKISKRSWFEDLNYRLDVLVPLNEETDILLPSDSFVQRVNYGNLSKWRIKKDVDRNLPPYLSDFKEKEYVYDVKMEDSKWFGPLTLGSNFLQKWDALALTLLLFTASVTPFETAFIHEHDISFDLLFLINRVVDLVFFIDIFIQMRTPYRDSHTGKLILDVKLISRQYLLSWFPLDIVSVLPFEFLGLMIGSGDSGSIGNLKLLRFVRLTRLLKLLRVFRASRKLKQATIASGLRYSTMALLKVFVIIVFATHWMACGYRLASERSADEQEGWYDHYLEYLQVNTTSAFHAYTAALYWASGVVSLIGSQDEYLAPAADREFIYASVANLLAYVMLIYFIAVLNAVINISGEMQRKQDILLDNYLEMFDMLQLDPRLKFTVAQHLVDHFASLANKKQQEMLQNLPKSLHCFIAMEIHLDFVLQIPFMENLVDSHQILVQELCQGIQKRSVPNDNFLFEDGVDGIYLITEGIVALSGSVYPSGSLIGLTCLRDNICKEEECRALTDVKCSVIPRDFLLALLQKHPKVLYYCKRWTIWQLLRDYILNYTRLYYTAVRRGALMYPPLRTKRPDLSEGELDDIDIAVLDHINEHGY